MTFRHFRQIAILCIVMFALQNLWGQANITIETNWTANSSRNRIRLYNPSNAYLGQICNPSSCYNYSSTGPYNNLDNPTIYPNLPYADNYRLRLYGLGSLDWTPGSYVRVYQDGNLILETTYDSDGDLAVSNYQDVYFDVQQSDIEVNDVSINEDDGNANLSFNYTGPSTTAFTIDYSITDITTKVTTDYIAATTGTLNFNGSAGQEITLSIPIIVDDIYEDDEVFEFNFTGSSDPTLYLIDKATVTIIDDDGIKMSDATINTCGDVILDSGGNNPYNANESLIFTICPDALLNYIRADFNSFDIDASDTLYVYDGISTDNALIGAFNNNNIPDLLTSTALSGCLTFQLITDNIDEAEGWDANVSCAPAGPRISIQDVAVDEDAGLAVFSVSHDFFNNTVVQVFPPSINDVPFEVTYETFDGTAIAGEDYTATTGTLQFNGTTGDIRTIAVPITEDLIAEQKESFFIRFTGFNTNGSGFTVDHYDTAEGSINTQYLENPDVGLFKEFDGFYNYTTTGGSLRTAANDVDACALTTSSTNTITQNIPSTATIKNAYLYWAHSAAKDSVDTKVTLDGNLIEAGIVNHNVNVKSADGTLYDRHFYGYVSDVTQFVKDIADINTHPFVFSDLNITDDPETGIHCRFKTVLGGWALLIFYEDKTTLSAANINLYNGFKELNYASDSYTLDSFYYADATDMAKATVLSWEGDPNLSGNTERLSITNQLNQTFPLAGDGSNTFATNAYNSTIYDNTANPIINNQNTYGIDLDTYNISNYISEGDTEITANVSAGQDLILSTAVVLRVPTNLIAGTVFEDINYPGGPGRAREDISNSLGIYNNYVELFDDSGRFVKRVRTDINGFYTFGGVPDGSYSVKVSYAFLRSSRNNGINCFSCYPVQTFRRNFSGTDISNVTNEVGGSDPTALQDSGLGILSGALSVSQVSINKSGLNELDFGFNFNTIVNTNYTGHGSLRQFVTNTNGLRQQNLDIEANSIFDPEPGDDVSIFMIPSTSDPLGRTADPNFNNGVFDINQLGLFVIPSITDEDTNIDGRTQTANIGDTNTGTVYTSTPQAGISSTALSNLNLPEVQVRGQSNVLNINDNKVTVRGLSVYHNSGGAAIMVNSGQANITENIIGLTAKGEISGNTNYGIRHINGEAQINNNYISNNSIAGIWIQSGTTSAVLQNHLFSNGSGNCDDNIRITSGSNILIEKNLIENSASAGIDLSSNNVVIFDNTIINSGQNNGNCGFYKQDMGIRVSGSGNTISQNIIANNGGPGVHVNSGNNNTISQNSFYANGSNDDALAIDLSSSLFGLDNVTLNDENDFDFGPNNFQNFPIISSAVLKEDYLIVSGWCASGATVEIYFTDTNEGTANFGDNQFDLTRDYGEGQTFIGAMVEGSADDLDATSSDYLDADGNENNTSKFRFHIPLIRPTEINESITATATASNATSEFSPNTTIKLGSIITNKKITYRTNR